MDAKQQFLANLYNDPEYGFVGKQALYRRAKTLDRTITMKDVSRFYQSRLDIQRFQDQKPQYGEFNIASDNPNSWQMDLAFWLKKPLLTAININSRLGYAELLPNKTGKAVLEAIKVFTKANRVEILTTDNGSEFMNKAARAYFKSEGVDHYNNEPGDHTTVGKIERFNRTLKQRLMKLPEGTTIDSKLIKALIRNYNNSINRAIGMTPNKAKGTIMTDDLHHNKTLMTKLDNELGVGQSVLYRLKKGTFDKEGARWSKAVHQIVGIDGYRIQIRSKNRHTLYKSPNDLKIVKAKTTDAPFESRQIYEAERILNHRKVKSGKLKY
ncbi:unnamed protein product [Phytophthora lilii]|uniref:Unnamed protein product n=1 Tax=Phytophthora lilii TaxID=2077276 RepID=A0A9W6YHZ8_9STRA|nr:unnamed protein product [Phytophthora lilii]